MDSWADKDSGIDQSLSQDMWKFEYIPVVSKQDNDQFPAF